MFIFLRPPEKSSRRTSFRALPLSVYGPPAAVGIKKRKKRMVEQKSGLLNPCNWRRGPTTTNEGGRFGVSPPDAALAERARNATHPPGARPAAGTAEESWEWFTLARCNTATHSDHHVSYADILPPRKPSIRAAELPRHSRGQCALRDASSFEKK